MATTGASLWWRILARFSSKPWPIDLTTSAKKLRFFPKNSAASGLNARHRYDVRRAQTAGTGTDKQHLTRDLLHRSVKSIRLFRSCATMGSSFPFWSFVSDDQGHPHVPRWYAGSRTAMETSPRGSMSARASGKDVCCRRYFFNIFFAALITVVLHRFAADPLTVSDLAYLGDAPRGEGGRPTAIGTLGMVRRAVWGMLIADDAEVASTSPLGLARMMDVIVVACQEFGLIVSEKKTEAMHLGLISAQRQTRCELKRQTNGVNRQQSLGRARTSTPRLSVASAPLGQMSEDTVSNCTVDGTPSCRSRYCKAA